MIVLKIIGIVIGALVLFYLGFIILAAWAVLSGEEHKKRQFCPECGKKAKYFCGTTEEAGGQLSYTDAIHAQYRCPKGHRFQKTWTVRNPLG